MVLIKKWVELELKENASEEICSLYGYKEHKVTESWIHIYKGWPNDMNGRTCMSSAFNEI